MSLARTVNHHDLWWMHRWLCVAVAPDSSYWRAMLGSVALLPSLQDGAAIHAGLCQEVVALLGEGGRERGREGVLEGGRGGDAGRERRQDGGGEGEKGRTEGGREW